MRIGIDARLYGSGLGLGRYVSKLIEYLELNNGEHSYVIFLRKENFECYHPSSPRFEKVCADVPWYSLREQIILPWIFFRSRCDLLHIPHFNVPLLYPGRLIVTIHDLILLKHPQSATSAASTRNPFIHWFKYQCYRLIIIFSLARACRVITVSHAVERDVRQKFPFVSDKLRTIYEAAASLPVRREEQQIPTVCQPYFLYAGNAYPHKNLSVLIDAMNIVKQTHSDVRLILCGQEDFFQKRIIEKIHAARADNYISHIGCVPDGVLRWLYEHAAALVLPSREEGFGLQILEAFMHACPVIASRIPPYEEIGEDAVFFIDPQRAESIAHGMNTILTDEKLRTMLIKRGAVRCRDFSWNTCAQKTVLAYNECLSRL